MKHIFRSFIALSLCLSLILSLSGCSLIGSVVSGETVEVTFVIGTEKQKASVPYGETVSPPLTPKVKNRIFSGWYTDPTLAKEYDFSTPVRHSFSLYAGFSIERLISL